MATSRRIVGWIRAPSIPARSNTTSTTLFLQGTRISCGSKSTPRGRSSSNVQTDQGQRQSPSAQAAQLLTFDPGVVLDTSARNAFLNSFNGVSIDRTWSLFRTDLSSGGTQQL